MTTCTKSRCLNTAETVLGSKGQAKTAQGLAWGIRLGGLARACELHAAEALHETV